MLVPVGNEMKKKIMVIDDLPDQLFTIKTALELYDDFQVIGIESGEQCIKYLENGDIPDIILTESRMLGMNGIDIIQKIRENPLWENIPIAFLTAWIDLKNEELVKFNVKEIIEKPFDMRDLRERIESMLKN